MPYITQDRRLALTPGVAAENGGELNYLFSMLVLECDDCSGLRSEIRKVIDNYIQYKGMKYQYVNDVMGALTGARLEMSRRLSTNKWDSVFEDVLEEFYFPVVAPYENTKIKENGDLPYGNDQA